jgi:hypothetical protein|tara:strand:+ start:149 stop:334 length:186 start_codon:yes stop_codon:yes gene_type:complete
MKSKDDKRDNTLESCGCIKDTVADTGHYCSKIPEEFKVALGFATDCFDINDLEEHMSRTLH